MGKWIKATVIIVTILILSLAINVSRVFATIGLNIKSIWSIDTNLDGPIYQENGLTIHGWILATQANNKIEVYINDKKLDDRYIKYSRKYDLISIIKGYGTYAENPLPNFDIHIPIEEFDMGRYDLEIRHVTEDGQTILQSMKKQIYITRDIKYMLCVDTKLQGQTFGKDGIQIEGWRLATEPNTKLQIEIDGLPIEFTQEDKRLYDLISIIQGYGTYKENPLPNFKIKIPTTNILEGKHKLTIKFMTEKNEVLKTHESEIIIEKIRHMLNIDTKLQGQTFDKNGITIEGWKLATEPNTKIQIKIDGELVEFTQKDMLLYDLISIIKGYGTYAENPLPNYKIHIPTAKLQNGKHKLEIEFLTANDELLEKYESQIIIDKSIKHMWNIDTNLDNIIFNENKNIVISGWKLATEPNTEIKILIDGQPIETIRKKYSLKYDLISIVQGYGTYAENPTPNFDITIDTTYFTKRDYQCEIQLIAQDGVTVLRSQKFIAKYGEKYDGIDVSRYNTVTDWNKIAQSGIDYVMIRIGYRGYRNPNIVWDDKALEYIKGAKSAGLKVGVYFVTQAINEQEAQEEAQWVVNQIRQNGIQLDYPIVLDTEDSGARLRGEEPGRADLLDKEIRTRACKAFLDVIKANGYTTMIYANSYWFNYELNFSEFSNYEIWLAHYTHNESVKPDFSGNYHMWQYTDSGSIPGISGVVDLNSCYKKY